MKTTTDQDENGIAERKENARTAANVCNVNDIIFYPEKSYHAPSNATKAFGVVYSSVYTRADE